MASRRSKQSEKQAIRPDVLVSSRTSGRRPCRERRKKKCGGSAPRTPRVFFFASDDTGAARTSGRTSGGTPGRTSCVSRLKRKPEKYIEKYFEQTLHFGGGILFFIFFVGRYRT